MKRISVNIAAIAGSDLTRKLFGFLTVTYLTRHISVSDFGVVNLGLTVLSYILMIGAAGLPLLGMREIARLQSEHTIGGILATRLLVTLTTILIVIGIVSFFVTNPIVASMIIFTALTAIPNSLFLDWYFLGKERMGVIGIARGIGAALNFTVIVLFVHSPSDIIWVAAASFLSDLSLCMTYAYFFTREHKALDWNFSFRSIAQLMKKGLPLGVGTILAQISTNFAPLFIGIALTTHEVGLYSAANKLVFFLLMFDRVLATLMFPASSRIYAQDPEMFIKRLEQAQKLVFLIALPVCLGGMLLSSQVIQFIFGAEYAEAAPVLSVIVWFLLLTMLQTIYNAGLVALGREKDYARVMIITAILYCVCISLGTLRFGIQGASFGFIAAEILSVIFSRRELSKTTRLVFSPSLFRILFAALLMAGCLMLLPVVHVLILIGAGALIYGLALFILRAITISEMEAVLRRVW